MFKGFGKWLRGPTAEDVSLEMIGVVKGTQKLFGGQGDNMLSGEVGKIVNRAERVLEKEGHTMHPDIKRFLKDGVEALGPLATMRSSEHNGENWFGPGGNVYLVQKPKPEWKEKFRAAQRRLDGQADQLFDSRFAEKVAGETKGMDRYERDAYTRQNPSKSALVEQAKRRNPGLGQ